MRERKEKTPKNFKKKNLGDLRSIVCDEVATKGRK